MTTRNPNLDAALATAAAAGDAGARDFHGPRGDWWWTGRAPLAGVCPGVGADGVIRSLPLIDLATCTRQDVHDYFDNTWTLTEVLLASLQGEQTFRTPPYHRLRHPFVFYLAHPAVLYVNKLRVAGLVERPIDPYFEQLFETGVDEMSWDDMSRGEMEWPSLADVIAYRRRVHRLVHGVIDASAAFDAGHRPITAASREWALVLGFEHERIHLETSSVLIRELPVHLLRRPEAWPPLHPSASAPSAPAPQPGRDYPPLDFVAIGDADVRLGKPADWPSFGWDNEYGTRAAHVQAFRASRHLVANGAFYEFVAGGGYLDEALWTADGWRWRQSRNAKWPTFWVPSGPAGLHQYRLRTLFEHIDMPWAWPVDVNWYEAKAFCAWLARRAGDGRAYRLLTETEHHRLRTPEPREASIDTSRDAVMRADSREMAARGANLHLAHGSECPVDASPANALGVHDEAGNVWQWCEDDFHPLDGFSVHPFYDDFSTPCFDGEHKMILGGSFASTGDEASIWARFHFRPHFFQHAGFRLVATERGAACDAVLIGGSAGSSANTYDTPGAFEEYMLLHWGADADLMPYAFGPRDAVGFPRRVASRVIAAAHERGVPLDRALDVGGAVGATAFELARAFREVVSIDRAAQFVDAAETLRRDGQLRYRMREEGDIARERVAVVDPAIERSRVRFRRADACALPPELHEFDVVVLANLLCRLPSPRALLGRLGGPRGLVKPGGLLLVASPYTWSEEFTPRGAWLGGVTEDGAERRSRAVLIEILRPEFELLEEDDLPFLMREHARKFQYVVSHAMLWRRRPA